MRIGKYRLTALETGRFCLDGGAMFGVVPKVLWNRSNPADDRNRIELALRTLIIRDEEHRMIVDTGIGENWDQKFSDIYGVDHSRFSLEKSLLKAGLSPGDITDVIITHLHFDHAGGATRTNEKGETDPTFPNATYYIQKRHYEWAVNPSEKDQASFVKERFVPLYEQGRLKLLEGEMEFLPGIHIRLSDGHTIAQQNVLVTDGKTTLYHPGDMIPTSSHVPLPFIMGYDNFPLITLEEKKNLLRKAADGGWVLFFEHDPNHAATQVEKTDRGYKAGKPVDMNAT